VKDVAVLLLIQPCGADSLGLRGAISTGQVGDI
jgi:hypothetical protein